MNNNEQLATKWHKTEDLTNSIRNNESCYDPWNRMDTIEMAAVLQKGILPDFLRERGYPHVCDVIRDCTDLPPLHLVDNQLVESIPLPEFDIQASLDSQRRACQRAFARALKYGAASSDLAEKNPSYVYTYIDPPVLAWHTSAYAYLCDQSLEHVAAIVENDNNKLRNLLALHRAKMQQMLNTRQWIDSKSRFPIGTLVVVRARNTYLNGEVVQHNDAAKNMSINVSDPSTKSGKRRITVSSLAIVKKL